MKKPELLAPAGNFEKLKYAIRYGADAVYLAGNRFGLRAKADNFSPAEIAEAAAYVHDRGKKVYVTLNIIAHNQDFTGLEDYVRHLDACGVDGVIVADPGVFSVVHEVAPGLRISMSTQANNTNWHTARFWAKQGAGRMVLARELTFPEIAAIVEKAPENLEIETFVHGAMCISYSGRCLLSNYLTDRDGNHGDCAQPCRWQYQLVERTRPDEVFTIEDSDRGSFIFNSKDLCLLQEIPQLMAAGVDSFKIEGRMKSLYYVATVVQIYRRAIDFAYAHPGEPLPAEWVGELEKVSHRNYTTAFFHGPTDGGDQNYGTSSYTRHYDFAGVVLDYDEDSGLALVEQRGKISAGDELEIMVPDKPDFYFSQTATELFDLDGQPLAATPHPKMRYSLKLDQPVCNMAILRKKSAQL